MANDRRLDPGNPFRGDDPLEGRRVLLIDVPPELQTAMPGLERADRHEVRFRDVDIDLVARHDPQMVLSPLVGRGFDIMDVGALLLRCGYLGPLRALTAPLPNLGAVRSEVRSHCVGLDFDLLVLSPPPATGH